MSNGKRERSDRRDNDRSEGKAPFKSRRAKKKVCSFCAEKVTKIDYKDIAKIKKFISERGKILPRRISGTCAKHQREVRIAIVRARHVAFLPYTTE